MKYDFVSIIERRGMDAAAVDSIGSVWSPDKPRDGFDIIPMWVADMNFPTAPSITEALVERAKHPIYGYFLPREEYFSSIIDWQKRRNGVTGLSAEHITFEGNVLGGLQTALSVLCSKGDNVLIHGPTYHGFISALQENGYNMVVTPLKQDENGVYRMDYEDMEQKISMYNIHAAILCSPHNPTGRVWEKEELEKAMEVFKKHDVTVIADEIWSDLVLYNNKHIPTQSVSEDAKNRTISFYAPSKTFNLSGIMGAYSIIYNKRLRERMAKEASVGHYNFMHLFAMHALIGAYKETGHEWVDELRQVLTGNVEFAADYVEKHFEGVKVTKPEGTYMLFLDCKEWLSDHNMTLDELVKAGCDVGVIWQSGAHHGGPTHVRMNLALPLSRVQEAFDRLDKYVFNVKD